MGEEQVNDKRHYRIQPPLRWGSRHPYHMGQDANVIQCIEVEVSSNRQDGAGSHDPNAAGLKETLRKKVFLEPPCRLVRSRRSEAFKIQILSSD